MSHITVKFTSLVFILVLGASQLTQLLVRVSVKVRIIYLSMVEYGQCYHSTDPIDNRPHNVFLMPKGYYRCVSLCLCPCLSIVWRVRNQRKGLHLMCLYVLVQVYLHSSG